MCGDAAVGLLYVLGTWRPNKSSLHYFLSAGEWKRLLPAETFFFFENP